MNKDSYHAKKKTNSRSSKIIQLAIIVLALVLVGSLVGLGTNFLYSKFVNKESAETVSQSSSGGKTVEGINYTSDLPESGLKYISDFLNRVYQAEYKPNTIEIKLVTKAEQTGDVYVGTWVVNSKAMFILYVSSDTNAKPRYLRTWGLDTGTSVTQKLAETSITAYFNKDFVASTGELKCSEIKNPESTDSTRLTDCAGLSTIAEGDKVGISVRAPILIQTGEKGTSTAACFVPKETAANYIEKTCI